MKKLLLFISTLFFYSSSFSQMTLAHHFASHREMEIGEVELSRSGRKIVTMRHQTGYVAADTLFFYNTDYSFWKMIPCPAVPRLMGRFNFYSDIGTQVGVFYPSEQLFNLDTLLEVAIFHYDSAPTVGRPGPILIINENGSITDSIPNVFAGTVSGFKIYGDTAGRYHAYVSTMTGPSVYDLPGSLPCARCVTRTLGGMVVNEPAPSILTQPIPNPSKDEVKIAFTLPEGHNKGLLQLYNNNGQLVKSCQVDDRFGFIILDNKLLPAGMYYYNIVVPGGIVSSTQKLVVVK